MSSPPEKNVTGLCPHFGDCRGCQSQDMPYTVQLEQKETVLRGLFQAFWTRSIPVTASPVIWHYRNKVDPSFAGKHYEEPPPKEFVRETVLGFKKRWYWPLEIDECRIGPEGLPELLAAVRTWYRERGLRAFNARSREGFLRHLLVRDAKRTGERMVVLITCAGDFDADPFVKAVLQAFHATSIYRGINTGSADVATAEKLDLLHGTPEITERLRINDGDGERTFTFRISPMSFFQTNPMGTERLYGFIRAWVKRAAPSVLYDLYGGMGGIALTSADLVKQVWSIDNVPEASRDGRHNAAANGIKNVTFLTEKVKDYLRHQLEAEGLPENSAVVVDPARPGLHPKALKRLMRLAPTHLLYVCCNPKQLGQELPQILEHYELRDLKAVDLFPHTRHVEVVAELLHL